MKREHEDEHMDVASHFSPALALSVRHRPYFLNPDSLNYAMLDYLTQFTSKVRRQFIPQKMTVLNTCICSRLCLAIHDHLLTVLGK